MDDSGLSMDQELAKKLLVDGATLIILNLPVEIEFGIDLKSWHTGKKFRGVKMIPPGLHMVYYNTTSKFGDIAPRVSFLHNFKKSEFVVKKWDADLEEIISDYPSEEELSRLKENLFNLDQYLGPYPFDILDKWKSLIKNVSDKLVNRVTPECGVIRSALDLVSGEGMGDSHVGTFRISAGSSSKPDRLENEKESGGRIQCEEVDTKVENPGGDMKEDGSGMEDAKVSRISQDKTMVQDLPSGSSASPDDCQSSDSIKRRRRRDLEEALLPNLCPTPGTQLRFTSVPEDLFPKGSTPADITRHSIDRTFTLDTLLASMENEKEYVGEVELSFACFLVGLSMDALEAWKRLVTLACRCEHAVSKRPLFYGALLASLNAQLQHIPEDFLVDIVESENAIYTSLRDVFRSTLTCDGVDPRLRKAALTFSQKLSERFGWDFTNLDQDDEDEAPVIVDLENCS